MIKMDYETYNCTLKTKSPVIIKAGDDFEYESNEYLFSKAKTKKGAILDIIKRVDVSKYYHSLDENKKDEFLSNLLDADFMLNDYAKSNSDVKKYTNYYSINMCKNNPKNSILEHVKTLNKLYIPGSSIKGALLTSILYDKVNTRDIDSLINNNHIKRKKYNDFMKKYFSADKNFAQNNIMRFIQITDTNTIKLPYIYDIQTIKAKEKTYEYHKKRNNIIYTYHEAIGTNRTLNSEITLKKDEQILKKLSLSNKENILDMEYIKEAIYTFSMDYIDYELDFTDKYNIDFLYKYYEKLYKENTIDAPLIRIGTGSGFMQTTINMKTKEKDKYLFEKIRKTSTNNSYQYEYPKSRKITCQKKEPLGWIQLTFNKK